MITVTGAALSGLPVLFVCSVAIAQHCDTSSRYSQPNFILKGHVIDIISGVTSKERCIDKCRSHSKCHSINFYPEKLACEVNKANHLSNPESLGPSVDGEYISFSERPPARCSDKLCSGPHPCTGFDDKDGNLYRCCDQGEMILRFPRKSVQDYMAAENLVPTNLTEFSLSMWLNMDSDAATVDTFSYCIKNGNTNEILIELTDKTVWISVGGGGKTYSLSKNVQDNKWHHYCYTWRSDLQKHYFYVDGKLEVEANHAGISEVKGGGAVVLGQDQDSYKGGFQQYQSYKGSMSKINMWDKFMNASECAALYHACSTGHEGNFIKWSDLYTKPLFGNLSAVCSDHCT